ncbi:MAG: Si-specific NAD(P)(+) transhydrogenase [Gemmatimonadaceae bacterium]|nr:Si-specific NAD(P)(+) transhydrogenase [Gemmatimonadaceae bacterium]
MTEHFDLVVVGAGPAGEKGAAQAAYFGKKVCLIERAPKPGGAAVNTGTIPANTLRESAVLLSGLRRKGLYGVEFHIQPDLSVADFMQRERQVIERSWRDIEENLARHQITAVQGSARFTSPQALEVTRHGTAPRSISGDIFLIASGARPWRPAHVPFDGTVILDSTNVPTMPAIPPRMVIIGGGTIGCTYACVFAALGAHVTLVTSRDRLLAQFEHEVGDALRREMTRRLGVQVLLGLDVTRIDAQAGLGYVTVADGTTVVAESVLYCAGREGTTAELGLENAGVATAERGFIVVDDKFRTSTTHIYAAGDVIGYPGRAAVAMEQARVAMCHAFGLRYKQAVSSVVPFGVWTIPEVASVGLTEAEARARGIECEVGRAELSHNARGQILGETTGFVKLVFNAEDQRLLGATVVGEGACEIIHLPSAVLAHEGTLDYFIQAVFGYPSLTEAFKYAAYDGLQRLQRRVEAIGGLDSTG